MLSFCEGTEGSETLLNIYQIFISLTSSGGDVRRSDNCAYYSMVIFVATVLSMLSLKRINWNIILISTSERAQKMRLLVHCPSEDCLKNHSTYSVGLASSSLTSSALSFDAIFSRLTCESHLINWDYKFDPKHTAVSWEPNFY